jgi:hypothetical protein
MAKQIKDNSVLGKSEIQKLTHQQIHEAMLATAIQERDLTVRMITYIQEADRRKFYLEMGYGSLFDYLTLGLKYSNGAAMRRISSARLVREIPEVKSMIEDGSLSLSNLSQAQQFFKMEERNQAPLDIPAKKEIISQLIGKSTREAEKTLIHLSSQPHKLPTTGQIKPVRPELSSISFLATQEFLELLEESKGLLAHRMPDASLSEIMTEVVKHGLDSLRKKKYKLKESVAKEDSKIQPEAQAQAQAQAQGVTSGAGGRNDTITQLLTRPIPAETMRKLWKRDQGQCVVVSPHTGKPCGSKYQIEPDHIIPWAVGGDHSLENLRLSCRKCNQRNAVQWYGMEKMGKYLSS